jgi:putative glutamine amidotransferase
MGRPVIGLSTYVEPARWGAWEVPAALLHEWYVDAVRDAGGRPVLLPPDSNDDDVLDRIDGLILIGGADVGPANYGAEPHPTVDAPRVERDASELLLCREPGRATCRSWGSAAGCRSWRSPRADH